MTRLISPLVLIKCPSTIRALIIFYIFLIGLFAFRVLTLPMVVHAAAKAMLLSSVIMLTVGAANLFSWLALYEQFGVILTDAMFAISENAMVLLLVLNILLLILGTFMEPLTVMLLLGPIIFPFFTQLGVDPIHLGVVIVINLTLGLITPPVGIILNVVALIARIEVSEVFRSIRIYLVTLVTVLLVITYVPALSLWLPQWLMGK